MSKSKATKETYKEVMKMTPRIARDLIIKELELIKGEIERTQAEYRQFANYLAGFKGYERQLYKFVLPGGNRYRENYENHLATLREEERDFAKEYNALVDWSADQGIMNVSDCKYEIDDEEEDDAGK